MNFSPKAVRFIIEALENYLTMHDEQMRQAGLSDDEISDLANDRQYLEAIQADFEKYQQELAGQRENATAET